MRTKIEEMGLDLYNALRGPLSQMESADEMDNFKIELGNNKEVIAECIKCAQINIESGKNMMKSGIKMNWAMIDYYNNLIIEACKNAINKEEKEMKKQSAQCNIIEITVDGIKYTQTRPGYYYKKTEDGHKRIPKSEWEQAFDKYTEISKADEEWDMEQEIEDRKAEQDKKDRETEQNFNGKKAEPKTKKAPVKKARRSKDVAFEMDTIEGHITLTAKQVEFLKLLPNTNFWEDGIESILWCDCIADDIKWNPMSVGAMISTLREKSLITVTKDTSRKGNPKGMAFTAVGQVVAQKLGLN